MVVASGGGEDTHNHSYIMCREILFGSKIHDIYRGYGNPSIYIVTRPNKTKKKKENEIQNPPPTKEALAIIKQLSLPCPWPKPAPLFALWIQPRTRLPITPLLKHLSPPPAKPVHPPRIHKAKKHHHQSERQARIQRRRQRHCVFTPPLACASPQNVVEHKTHDRPRREVESSLRSIPPRQRCLYTYIYLLWEEGNTHSGGDPAQTPKHDGQRDSTQPRGGAVAATGLFPGDPDNERCDCPERECPYERPV